MKLLFPLFLFLIQQISFAENHKDSILVIHSYFPNNWTKRLDLGFKEQAILRGIDIQFYHYDSGFWKEHPEINNVQEISKIINLAKQNKYTGIIISDDEASEALQSELIKLNKPILYTGINRNEFEERTKSYCSSIPRTAVLLEAYPFSETLKTVKKVIPKIKKISIIAALANTTDSYIEGLKKELVKRKSNIVIDSIKKSNSWEVWKEELLKVDKTADLIWVSVPYGIKDRLNEEVSQPRISSWLKENIKTKILAEVTLAEAAKITVGLDAKYLAIESINIFENLLNPNTFSGCIHSSKYFKIVVKK